MLKATRIFEYVCDECPWTMYADGTMRNNDCPNCGEGALHKDRTAGVVAIEDL